ncbi:hypothetical protein FKP32DRAFT_856719 [Trametes sanguinea]|nr:hypothetical protein FKP32DRAFT_856719 [Trametes sanguinea]
MRRPENALGGSGSEARVFSCSFLSSLVVDAAQAQIYPRRERTTQRHEPRSFETRSEGLLQGCGSSPRDPRTIGWDRVCLVPCALAQSTGRLRIRLRSAGLHVRPVLRSGRHEDTPQNRAAAPSFTAGRRIGQLVGAGVRDGRDDQNFAPSEGSRGDELQMNIASARGRQ